MRTREQHGSNMTAVRKRGRFLLSTQEWQMRQMCVCTAANLNISGVFIFHQNIFYLGLRAKSEILCACVSHENCFPARQTHTHHNKTTLVKIIPHFWEKQSHCKADRRCVHWNLQAAQNAIRRRYNQNYTFKKLANVTVCTTSSVFFLPLLYNATSAPQWSDTAAIHVFNRLNSWQAAGW